MMTVTKERRQHRKDTKFLRLLAVMGAPWQRRSQIWLCVEYVAAASVAVQSELVNQIVVASAGSGRCEVENESLLHS